MFIYCLQLGFSLVFSFNAVIVGHTRFFNFHGEANARLERNFSVYGDQLYCRTLLIKTLSLVLFSAPDFHLKTLQNMWVDGIMHRSVWLECMKKMSAEWQEFVFFVSSSLHACTMIKSNPQQATVMLNANVAFLAIQSVDVNNNGGPYRSPAQISSYLSVIANIGSIILGLLLMRQNRTKCKETADEAVSCSCLPNFFSYVLMHAKAGISCFPSSPATRSGNTRDLVQSSLCSPDVGVCSPSIHSKFIVAYFYYYHQYGFIPRRILFHVLPRFQHANSKSVWLTLRSGCYPCWLVRLDFLGKARGRPPDPTLYWRRRTCSSRWLRRQEFVELSVRKAHEPTNCPKIPGRGPWRRNDGGLNITTILRWPTNCTICYDCINLWKAHSTGMWRSRCVFYLL